MNTQKQIGVIVTLLFMLVAGCAAYTVVDLPHRAPMQAEWHMKESVERGALLYANNCRTCHGMKGEGGVGPPLNIAEFQNQDPLVLRNNKALLTRTLNCGRAGSLMPAWLDANGGALNVRQIEHLVHFLTAPSEGTDAEGLPTNFGWEEAAHFGRNLNSETVLVVGGDTLDTIAKAHLIGIQELLDRNPGWGPDQVLPKGTVIRLLDGSDYRVRRDRETIARIADSTHTGAAVIADLNGIPYRITERLGNYTMILGDSDKSRSVGLIPGATLALPANARYILRAGDTLQSIAEAHGLTPSAIVNRGNNRELLSTTAPGEELDAVAKLELPPNPVVIVGSGDTLRNIADRHGIEADALAQLNGLTNAEAPISVGQQLRLPPGTRYNIQPGDTLASVANSHAMTVADLAALNGLQPGDRIAPEVIIDLPKVDAYVVVGQSLADIAATLSNVTAASLAAAQDPPAEPNTVYAIGTTLKMPEDAWGSAPPDAINPGTACVQHAIPQAIFDSIFNPIQPPSRPTVQSRTLEVAAHANDWTVIADGVEQEPNRGAALIAVGTAVRFYSVVGLHNVTINGNTLQPDLNTGQELTFTFNEEGEFKITCTYHPAMHAWIWVGEPAAN